MAMANMIKKFSHSHYTQGAGWPPLSGLAFRYFPGRSGPLSLTIPS